ncbi:putative flavonoid 3-hydroxylase [Hypoxylon sp. FL1284]|nr:putative flavonoid 3-hydroxylase [Hypoxylon sp. FL1284]
MFLQMLLLGLVLYPFLLGLYRIYFHPLAKFPGPKIAAATGWYETYVDIFSRPKGNFMEEISRMHDIYGPIVRINPHEIHIRDPSWISRLYKGHRDKYPPTAFMTGTPKGIFGTVSHELHRLRRSAISPLFSKSDAAKATPIMYDNVDLLLQRMDEQVLRDGAAEIRMNYLALATDNVADHFTGQPRGLLQSETKASEWRTSIRALGEWTLIGRHFSWLFHVVLKLPTWVLELLLPDIGRIANLHRVSLHPNLTQRLSKNLTILYSRNQQRPRAAGEKPNLFLAILSNDSIPPHEKAFDRISQEGVVAVAAGGETTARALTVATYFLLAGDKALLANLLSELRSAMPLQSSRPSVQELENLPWLTAIIKESLRIMALSTTRFPVVYPKGSLRYKDWVIPAGSPVSMTIRDLLLDPDVFEDPREFQPERWLSAGDELERLNHNFVPFGRGNRMCAGINFAYAELYIVLASLFRRRHLELYNTIRERDIDIVRDCFVGEPSPDTKGVRIRITGVED